MSKLIERYLAQREELAQAVRDLQDTAVAEDRDLTAVEEETSADLLRQIEDIDPKIEALQHTQDVIARHAAVSAQVGAQATSQKVEGGTPLTITPREVKYDTLGEYMVDFVRSIRFPGDQSGMPRYSADAAQRVSAALGRAVGDVAAGDHVTTADTPGLLPKNIVGDIAVQLDAARPLVDKLGAKDLSGISGKSFSRPTITKYHDQGDGKQTAEKGEGQGGEVVISGIDFTKESFLRWMNVSMQTIDWTAPAAWDVLMNEFLAEYALDTEIAAETALVGGVSQSETVATDDYAGWVAAMYAAKTKISMAGGKRRAALRIPDTIVVSADMDASIGALIDIAVATAQKVEGTPLSRFGGLLTQTPRIVAPTLPAKTVLYGKLSSFEFYEQRKGYLQAIEPKVMGVEVAYGGYAAMGHTDATMWSKLATA